MLRIQQPNVWPPGGFQYTQPETGMFFNGNLPFKAQCYAIYAHRKANNLPRANPEQIAEDLVLATCTRLPAICTNSSSKAPLAATVGVTRRCGTCGGQKLKK